MIKAELRHQRKHIIFYTVLFTLLFIALQIGLNLLNSDLTIESRGRKYNITHTEIRMPVAPLDNELNTLHAEMLNFLENYPNSHVIEMDYIGSYRSQNIEPYHSDGYNNYKVVEGKALEDLSLFELAVPNSLRETGRGIYNTELKIGDNMTILVQNIA